MGGRRRTGRWGRGKDKALRGRRDLPSGGEQLKPSGPPIQQTAQSLRRLLVQHRATVGSGTVMGAATRLRALECALTDCALQAADAVGVDRPVRRTGGPLPRAELRSLLVRLAEAGIVLPDADAFGR